MDQGTLPAAYDVLAPDGSEIRLAGSGSGASMVHCTLPGGSVSAAVRHRTVEELWLVVGGEGEAWRKRGGEQSTIGVAARSRLTIPLGTRFHATSACARNRQSGRATGTAPLQIVIATAPPWPGQAEAVREADHWATGQPADA